MSRNSGEQMATGCRTAVMSLAAKALLTLGLTVAQTGGPAAWAADGSAGFRDRTKELGIEPGGGAACWADVNADGWPDLIAGNVWLNDRGKRFRKGAEHVGTVIAADYDNDGLVDLFSWSARQLLHNLQGGDGEEFVVVPLPKLPATVARGACWADLNSDGFVDLYVGGYEDWNKGITYPDLVLLNEEGKGFRLASKDQRYRARGVTACDYDQDGDMDVYVSNYRLQPNVLWINDGTGQLADQAGERNARATSGKFAGGHAIGAAWGDFDNDGLFDLFAGNFAHVDSRGDQPKSRFLRNAGEANHWSFDDKGPCGVYYQESYAGPAAADFDNDMRLDLFFTTVYGVASFGKRNYPVLYRNAAAFQFKDVTAGSGLEKLPPTYQAAWADFDRDGDLDLVTAGRLFENTGADGHWLEVRLIGKRDKVNRSAVGAQVRIAIGSQTLTRQVEAGTGEGNQNSLILHFGLGTHDQPVTLSIVWPDGKRQEMASVAVDHLVTVEAR